MDSLSDLRQLKEEARKKIELAESLQRLYANRDFKSVFLDNYLKDEIVRLVLLRTEVGMDTEQGSNLLREIDSIGLFKNYLDRIHLQGELASKEFKEAEQAIGYYFKEENE